MASDRQVRRKSLFARVVWLCLLLVAGLFIAIMVYGAIEMVRGPKVGEHVSAKEAPFDLPADATDVCYITRPAFEPNRAFEFSTSEDSFVRWAQGKGYYLKEIGPEPFRIFRYVLPTKSEAQNYEAIISKGLFYEEWTKPDACTKTAYDREHQRAYWWSQTR